MLGECRKSSGGGVLQPVISMGEKGSSVDEVTVLMQISNWNILCDTDRSEQF